MALDISTILTAVQDHALASGQFTSVNGHEPKSAPGGLTAGVWVQSIAPARGASGLDSTTIRLGLTVRLYSLMTQEPADAIDPALVTALDVLMAAYSGDLKLGGAVRNVDLLGTFGEPLSAQAGYLMQAGTEYRVMDIVLPLIVNDLWEQEGSE